MKLSKIPLTRPALKTILWTDYGAFISLVILVMIWVIYVAWVPAWRTDGPIMSPELAPFYLYLAITASAVCLGILIQRVTLVWRVFRTGEQIRGRITNTAMQRDRGKVEYVFILKGKEQHVRTTLHRNPRTLRLEKNQHVMLVVDSSNPQRAFIRDIYL